MQLYSMPAAEVPPGRRVVALGFFDGMHRGHAALFVTLRQEAAARGATPAVFTFAEEAAFKPHALRLLSEEGRLQRMAEAGAEEIFSYSFTALRSLSPAAFVADVLVGTLSAVAVVCGYNFRFGAGGAGDATLLASLLAAHGVPLLTLPPCKWGETVISASAIRALLETGMVEEAADLLGRPYALEGRVVHGKALGRTIGLPTANLPILPMMAAPAHGVYAVLGYIEGQEGGHIGVANVGVRPTVEPAGAVNCETHFLDPVGDIYGKRLTVLFLHRLRGEQRFENLEALRARITQDAHEAKEYVQKWQNGQN